MTSEEVEDLARRLNFKLYRTCVTDNILVDEGECLHVMLYSVVCSRTLADS